MDEERRDWMGVLARTPIDLLRMIRADLSGRYAFRCLVGPEVGLLQLRAKALLTETPFHMGEATITRCVVEVGDRRGYGVVLGSDAERAELIAFFDALLQRPDLRPSLRTALLQPAEAAILDRRRRKLAEAQATAARFFTAARAGEAS